MAASLSSSTKGVKLTKVSAFPGSPPGKPSESSSSANKGTTSSSASRSQPHDELDDERGLNIWAGTWNLQASPISEHDEINLLLQSRGSPDIVCIAFQEIVELSAQSVFKCADGAPKAKINALLQPFEKAMRAKWHNRDYRLIRMCSMVGQFIAIYGHAPLFRRICEVDCDRVKSGVDGIFGNKGAVCIRFKIHGHGTICFCNVHLASGVAQTEDRKANLRQLFLEAFQGTSQRGHIRKPKNGFKRAGVHKPHLHDACFILGDFNFRLIPGPSTDLLSRDQFLRKVSADAWVYSHFAECAITFPPSYKYIVGTRQFDTKRAPAWCDRVLFGNSGQVQPLFYGSSSELIHTSDHRPVMGSYMWTKDPAIRRVRMHNTVAGTNLASQAAQKNASSPAMRPIYKTAPQAVNRELHEIKTVLELSMTTFKEEEEKRKQDEKKRKTQAEQDRRAAEWREREEAKLRLEESMVREREKYDRKEVGVGDAALEEREEEREAFERGARMEMRRSNSKRSSVSDARSSSKRSSEFSAKSGCEPRRPRTSIRSSTRRQGSKGKSMITPSDVLGDDDVEVLRREEALADEEREEDHVSTPPMLIGNWIDESESPTQQQQVLLSQNMTNPIEQSEGEPNVGVPPLMASVVAVRPSLPHEETSGEQRTEVRTKVDAEQEVDLINVQNTSEQSFEPLPRNSLTESLASTVSLPPSSYPLTIDESPLPATTTTTTTAPSCVTSPNDEVTQSEDIPSMWPSPGELNQPPSRRQASSSSHPGSVIESNMSDGSSPTTKAPPAPPLLTGTVITPGPRRTSATSCPEFIIPGVIVSPMSDGSAPNPGSTHRRSLPDMGSLTATAHAPTATAAAAVVPSVCDEKEEEPRNSILKLDSFFDTEFPVATRDSIFDDAFPVAEFVDFFEKSPRGDLTPSQLAAPPFPPFLEHQSSTSYYDCDSIQESSPTSPYATGGGGGGGGGASGRNWALSAMAMDSQTMLTPTSLRRTGEDDAAAFLSLTAAFPPAESSTNIPTARSEPPPTIIQATNVSTTPTFPQATVVEATVVAIRDDGDETKDSMLAQAGTNIQQAKVIGMKPPSNDEGKEEEQSSLEYSTST